MRWKYKYLAGFTAMSMLFTMPLVSAAEDDLEIFGEQYDDKNEPVAVVNKPEPIKPEPIKPEPINPKTINPKPTTPEPTNTESINYETNNPEQKNNIEPPTPIVEETPTENTSANEPEMPPPSTEIIEVVEVDESANDTKPADDNQNDIPVDIPIETVPIDNLDSANNDPPYTEPIDVNPVQPEVNSGIYNDSDENIYNASVYEPIQNSEPVYEPIQNNEPIYEPPQNNTPTTPERKRFNSQKRSNPDAQKKKARFVKLFSDDTYEYYLDRKAARWINMPYSTSEYMADVWIRMLEKNPNAYDDMPQDLYEYVSAPDDEIADAAAKGIVYDDVDVKVLRTKKYFLEHYYIRPKTNQIQFLCELEVIGRPQNAISERSYDYRNWENLIPGSIESSIYYSVLSDIGTGKASKRGHMTFVDMLDEYARIALN